MGKAYLKKLPQIYEFLKDDMEEEIEEVRNNGFPRIVGAFLSSASLSLKTIAICEFLLNQNVVALKNYYYNAAVSGVKSLEWYDKEIDNIKPNGSLSMYKSYLLEFAIISDSFDLMNKVAKTLGGRGEYDIEAIDKTSYHLGYAIKYSVLNEYDKASEHISNLLLLNPIEYIKSYANVLDGILNSDESRVNESLKIMCKEYSKFKENKNSPEEFFCESVVAVAKLAIIKGVNVMFDDGLAPKEVIETHELNYELVEYLK